MLIIYKPKVTKRILICILIFFIISCLNRNKFPDEPQLTYKDFYVISDTAFFIVSFTDGDGDIGTKDDTTQSLFIEYEEQVNGVWEKQNLALDFAYSLPFIEPRGKISSLEGEISVKLSPPFFNPVSKNDTFRLGIYVIDRAKHQSNTVFTPALNKKDY